MAFELRPAPKPPARIWLPRYREWIRKYPCPVCIRQGTLYSFIDPFYRTIDPHHIKTRGSGGDDPANIVPLCRRHHDELHRMGTPAFELAFDLNLRVYALLLWQTWNRLPDYIREPVF